MACCVDSKLVAPRRRLPDRGLCLGKFLDGGPAQQFLQLRAAELQARLRRVEGRLGLVEQLGGGQVTGMDLLHTREVRLAKCELVLGAGDVSPRGRYQFAAGSADEFIEARLCLFDRCRGFRKPRVCPRRVLPHEELTGGDRLALCDQDFRNRLRGLGGEFDPVGRQFTHDDVFHPGIAAGGEHQRTRRKRSCCVCPHCEAPFMCPMSRSSWVSMIASVSSDFASNSSR